MAGPALLGQASKSLRHETNCPGQPRRGEVLDSLEWWCAELAETLGEHMRERLLCSFAQLGPILVCSWGFSVDCPCLGHSWQDVPDTCSFWGIRSACWKLGWKHMRGKICYSVGGCSVFERHDTVVPPTLWCHWDSLLARDASGSLRVDAFWVAVCEASGCLGRGNGLRGGCLGSGCLRGGCLGSASWRVADGGMAVASWDV